MKKIITKQATRKQVETLEKKIFEKCKGYIDNIENTNDEEFSKILNDAMMFDVERGLLPGQIKHRNYTHSDWFIEFEDKLWYQINRRLETVGDNFFNIH